MSSDELHLLQKRIEEVHKLLADLENDLLHDPEDFDISLTLSSLRRHLKDIERQRTEIEAERDMESGQQKARTGRAL